ncbi:MAG TPA: hypothetical protein VGK39_00930 [Cyclobacteriaceae bacterium]
MKASAVLLLTLFAGSVSSQTVREMSLPWKSEQKINLNLKFADRINIQAWDKKEVFFKAEITINGGTLDHAHTMDSTIHNEEITIITDFDKALIPKNWCNCEGTNNFTINNKRDRQQICSEIYYTVYLPAGADLELKTISGDVKILNMKGAIDAESVSGEVEVIIPPNQKVDVSLKSVMGRVASYPDLTTLEDGLRPMLARKLNGKLNGGGKAVRLESVTGDVSLRSKQ